MDGKSIAVWWSFCSLVKRFFRDAMDDAGASSVDLFFSKGLPRCQVYCGTCCDHCGCC